MGQLSFADVDPLADLSLRETTFVVVDLETTGGRASGDGHDSITEIGAVKVRAGAVLGELATLVDPGRSIPPQIVALTGITTAMVCDAPRIDSVLPAFLEFARGAVLVAHNAGFDIGFRARQPNAARSPGPSRRCCARSGWRAGCSPGTKRRACDCPRWRDCSARRPHRRTGRSTTPAPPSTCYTGSSSGLAIRVCTPIPS
jgi:DNA polymerase III epsilon subunit-like protein